MSEMKTCAPSRAIASDIAWPMPSAAPVMTAVFPFKRAMSASIRAPAFRLVEGDRGNDDHAGDDQLPFGRQAEAAQTVGQELQDQHAERHAPKAADAAGEADAAEH